MQYAEALYIYVDDDCRNILSAVMQKQMAQKREKRRDRERERVREREIKRGGRERETER